jgi:hypothetical protein
MFLATPGRAGMPKLFARRPPALERLEHRWVPSAVRDLNGFSAATLPRGDDNSSRAVPLGFSIDFHGKTFDSLYVNNNGNVTFGSASGSFNPYSLSYQARPIIAPFFGDVDTRVAGEVRYGHYVQPAGEAHAFGGRQAFSVIWDEVGRYNQQADPTNTFQVILIDRNDVAPGAFDIEFNYSQIVWQQSTTSSAPYARAGFSTGSAVPAETVELPGSGQAGGLLDLVTRPDVRFEIRPNAPPVLDAVPSQVVVEGDTLDLKLTARDPDAGQTLTYSLVAGPAGAALDPATGRLTWTPTQANPLGQYTFRVAVTDSGGIPWTDGETFTVTLANADPVVDLAAPTAAHHPATYEFVINGRFDDPGQSDWAGTVTIYAGSRLVDEAIVLGPEPLALNPDKSYTYGHTFTREGLYTVVVTVTDSNGGVGTDSFGVNVLPASSAGLIETWIRVTAEKGKAAYASLENLSGNASLDLAVTHSADADGPADLFVGFYNSPPLPTRRAGVFFDLQFTGLVKGDTVTLTVRSEVVKQKGFQFGYFDPATGGWVDLLHSPNLAEVTIDQKLGLMVVRFKVTDIFGGTVFTVSLPSASTTTTTGTVQPPTASAGDGGGLSRSVTFTSNTQLSLALTASRDSSSSVSGTSQGSQAANAAANGVAGSGGGRSTAFSLTAGVGGHEESGEEDVFWRWLQTDEGLLHLLLEGLDPGLIMPRKAAGEPRKVEGVVPAAEAKDVADPDQSAQEPPARPEKPEEEPLPEGEFAAAALFAVSPYLCGQRRKRRRKSARR